MDIQPTNTLDFSNPQELDELSFANLIDPDSKPVAKKEEVKDTEEEEEEEITDKKDPNLEFTAKEDEEEASPINYVEVINILADKGIISEAYEGFDKDAMPDADTLEKLIEHNFNKRLDEQLDTVFNNLSDKAKRILEFDLNTKDENETTSFIKTLIEENSIKSLDVENEFDQEKILRIWYKDKMKFTQSEVEEKITELRDASLLEKEAKRLKPKLDDEAEKIAKDKEEQARELQNLERQVSENFNKKVIDLLSSGNVGGIKISKEEASSIYSFLAGDTIDITTPTGKKVAMPPLEAIIFYNKYHEKGSLETLALATLLLTNPKKFNEYYSKKANSEVSEKFYKEQKTSASIKIGGDPGKIDGKKEKPKKDIPWRLAI